MKWVVELSEFDNIYKLKAFGRGQALMNFIVEFVNVPEIEMTMEPMKPPANEAFLLMLLKRNRL